MAGAALIGIVWRSNVAFSVAKSIAPFGASLTFLALVTGMLWGQTDVGDCLGLGCKTDFRIYFTASFFRLYSFYICLLRNKKKLILQHQF